MNRSLDGKRLDQIVSPGQVPRAVLSVQYTNS